MKRHYILMLPVTTRPPLAFFVMANELALCVMPSRSWQPSRGPIRPFRAHAAEGQALPSQSQVKN